MTAQEVLDRIGQLEQLRSPHEYLWQEIGYLKNARTLDGSGNNHGFIPHSEIYDTTLRTKSRMQANGITSMLFPRDKDWLTIRPPWDLRNDPAAKRVYREAGEAVLHYLRQSNFHHINHGVISARSGDGTGCMRMEWMENDDGSSGFNFNRYFTMDYLIDHDSKGRVDTFACVYDWPASQAANEWGIENLSPKLQAEAKDIKKRNHKHKFSMLIEKRPKWERKGSGTKGMLYRVMVVEEKTKNIVVDSGTNTFDIISSRYETYQSPWGYSPAWEVLPDAYKANYAGKFMMVMGERAAVPPVIAPASLKEEGVGLGAAMVTYVSDLEVNAWPRELGSASNYQVGMDVWKQLRDSIDEAYHGHLFNMYNRAQREMTATEANYRRGELNAQLDPTITALNQDHTDPTITWVFNALVEQRIVELPDEFYNQATGAPRLPEMSYDNAITMTHNEGQALKAMELVDKFTQLAAVGADVDIIKLDEVARRIWRDFGQDEDDLYAEEEYQANQQAKAEAAQQAQAIDTAGQVASAARDASAAGVDVPQAMGM